jgi:outer membrane protein TolC
MKKKIITTLIFAIILSLPASAKKSKGIEVEKVAIQENSAEQTVEKTKIESVPSLNMLEEQLDKTKMQSTQIDTAKSVADKINSSLQKTEIQKQIENQQVDQIVNVDDCVKLALTNHPAILSAKSSAEIYKSKIAQAWSDYFPVLGVGIDYSRNDMLVTTFSPASQRYNLYYMPQLSASWKVFDFGKSKVNVDIAKKTYLASEDDVQSNINDVIYNVKKTYYTLLYSMQQEKVYADSVHDFTVHLAQANAFYRIGTKAKIDVLTAEYNLGKAKLDLIKAKNSVKLAYADVNNAIGIPEFKDYAIDENLETRTYEVDLDNMLQTAFETRPEYLAYKKKADASNLLIKASKRAFLPEVKAYASAQFGGKEPGKDVGYQFGANVAYSNFNALLLKKQVDESKATAKRDLAELEKIRQNVYLEVKQAYIDVQNAKDSIPVAQLAMMQAKEQYDLASGRYKVGLGDAVELKDAENTYRKAQLEYYSNLMNYNISVANLERVTGSPISPVVDENSTKEHT